MSRPGMSCSDNHLTDGGMHDASSNDDTDRDDRIDPYSAADLMGTSCWLNYVERWNPLRYQPAPKASMRRRKRRSA